MLSNFIQVRKVETNATMFINTGTIYIMEPILHEEFGYLYRLWLKGDEYIDVKAEEIENRLLVTTPVEPIKESMFSLVVTGDVTENLQEEEV